MDSGNSGSLQSSSGGGGGDDFDAACGGGPDSPSSSSSPLAALLRHQGFGGGGSALIYGLQDLAGAPPPSSHWGSTTAAAAAASLPPPTAGAVASPPPPLRPCHGGLASAADQTAAPAQQQPSSAPPPPRGSRKRARASRRAPTTVLTTDTSNFRAMVQEFTGIPAPPFAAARSRFDNLLLPSRSSGAAGPAATLPQFLLRPFAHKLQASYPPASTSSPAPANAAPAGASTAVAHGDGYQHHLATAAPPALLGMQDHGGGGSYLSFQFQSALAGQLDGGGGDAGKYPMFERGVAAPSASRPVPDPADFLGLAHGVVTSDSEGHLHQRNGGRGGHGGDELLSGLVGGCKATYSTASPLLERNGRGPPAGASTAAAATTTTSVAAATTAAMMRKQGVGSWVCSSSE